jgi:hypothetical protein
MKAGSTGAQSAERRDARLVEGLIDLLAPAEPIVRPDRVEAARARLVDGPQPSAEDIADSVVDVLVTVNDR